MARLIKLSDTSWKQPFVDRKKERHLWGAHTDVWDFCNFQNGTKRLINVKSEDRFHIDETRLFQITSGEISFPRDFINRIDPIVTNNPSSHFIFTVLDNISEKNAELVLKKNEQEQEELVAYIKKTKTRSQIINELKLPRQQSEDKVTIKSVQYKRDNYTIALIKQLRKNSCQICSIGITKADGSKYVEAAHINPKRENGSESPDNILILCPNCHKEFDLGNRKIVFHSKKEVEFILNGVVHKINLEIK